MFNRKVIFVHLFSIALFELNIVICKSALLFLWDLDWRPIIKQYIRNVRNMEK